jgi:biotin carboxyl carrier protein
MKRYRITLGGDTFDVKVLDDPRRERVRVEVDGETFTVGVEAVPAVARTAREEAAPAARLPKSSETSEVPAEVSGGPASTLTAPLPGVIKSIAVRPGQQVALDDELLVIEAMKMDNVIRASRRGTVSTIHVTEGRQVAYGEPLLDVATEGEGRGN